MARFDGLIFDLDGTLWDATLATTSGWNAGLEELELAERVTPEDIAGVAGLPYDECLVRLFGQVVGGHPHFRKTLRAHEQEHTERMGGTLYPGVAKGLPGLARQLDLFLVSNCQVWYLENFWVKAGLKRYFKDSDCHGYSGKSKAMMIEAMVDQHGLKQAVYIGDTLSDLEAAREAGVEFVHAAYGHGRIDEPRIYIDGFWELVEHLR